MTRDEFLKLVQAELPGWELGIYELDAVGYLGVGGRGPDRIYVSVEIAEAIVVAPYTVPYSVPYVAEALRQAEQAFIKRVASLGEKG